MRIEHVSPQTAPLIEQHMEEEKPRPDVTTLNLEQLSIQRRTTPRNGSDWWEVKKEAEDEMRTRYAGAGADSRSFIERELNFAPGHKWYYSNPKRAKAIMAGTAGLSGLSYAIASYIL